LQLAAWSGTAQADSSSSSSGDGGSGGSVEAIDASNSSTAAGRSSSSSTIAADAAKMQGTSAQTEKVVPPAAAAAAMLPPWLAVLARCLLALALALQTAAGTTLDTEASQQQPQCGDGVLWPTIPLCLQVVIDVGDHLHLAGIAAGPLQQLQQQQAALLPLLDQIPTEQPGDPAAPLAVLRSLQANGALQEMVSFAGGVCGQLPLRWGCNHPGCTNLAQRSEVLLVAGKSCVCGACRAAR
jgi:hypothetical protein